MCLGTNRLSGGWQRLDPHAGPWWPNPPRAGPALQAHTIVRASLRDRLFRAGSPHACLPVCLPATNRIVLTSGPCGGCRNLQGCSFSGDIPPQLGNLKNLKFLYVPPPSIPEFAHWFPSFNILAPDTWFVIYELRAVVDYASVPACVQGSEHQQAYWLHPQRAGISFSSLLVRRAAEFTHGRAPDVHFLATRCRDGQPHQCLTPVSASLQVSCLFYSCATVPILDRGHEFIECVSTMCTLDNGPHHLVDD